MQVSLLFILVLVPYCLGHGWMYDPVPSGFVAIDSQDSASTTAPCGSQPYTFRPPVLLSQNATLDFFYILGDGHTGQTCRVALSKTLNQASFDKGVLANNISCTNTGKNDYNVTFSKITPGLYYVQWIWTAVGSTWYSCFQVAIIDPNQTVTSLTYSSTDYFGNVVLDPATPVNYNISIPVGAIQVNPLTQLTQQYVLIKVNNSGESIGVFNATASSAFIPATYQDGYYTSITPGSVSYINLCSVKTNYVYVSIFPEIYGNYTYSISNSLYDSWLDWNGKRDQPISLDGSGFLVYWTQATSTYDVPKRIRLDGRGGNAYLMYKSTCNSQYTLPFSPVGCLEVQDDIQNGNNNANGRTQYYYVVTDASWYGKITIEEGTCSSAATVFLSLLLALVVLLF